MMGVIKVKHIWFVQQQRLDCNYLPLRWGLEQYSDEQINKFSEMFKQNAPDHPRQYCPKIYTTRTRRMKGEYYVVEGSRFKAKPVEPRIEFRVEISEEFDLRRGIFRKGNVLVSWAIASRNDLSFPELDLGIRGATFEKLRDELLRLNPKATIDTPFYVNLLEKIE